MERPSEVLQEPTQRRHAGRGSEALTVAEPGRGPRRGRILLMDDEPLMRDVMARQLRIFGWSVVSAAEGRQAVEIFNEQREAGKPFDAVILDLKVEHGLGGEETLEELLRLDPGVRAMVCSGSLAESVECYRRKGFRAVLPKPYTLEDLRNGVENLVGA